MTLSPSAVPFVRENAAPAPHVLIATAKEWVSTARLAMALASFGCRVDLVAPAAHPALVTGAITDSFPYHPLHPWRSLEDAVRRSQPTAIIPADELTLGYFTDLSGKDTLLGRRIRELLRHSVGEVADIQTARARLPLLALAEELGVAIPQTRSVNTNAEIAAAISAFGLPIVLKSDGSSGGQGVRVAQHHIQARSQYRALHRPPSLVRALKRGFVSHEWNHLRAFLRRESWPITAQQFVAGPERTGIAVAHRGQMLSAVALEVVRISVDRGPSSVVRVIDDPAIHDAMRAIIQRLNISGFCGFDFKVDEATGRPLLIEMNSRPTQLVHFAFGPGHDLVAAYVCALLNLPETADRPPATDNPQIALFPLEIQRDPNSAYLGTSFHDLPTESPELIARALKRNG